MFWGMRIAGGANHSAVPRCFVRVVSGNSIRQISWKIAALQPLAAIMALSMPP